MNPERLIQMILRIVIARGVGLAVNRAFGWFQRRGNATAARVGKGQLPPDDPNAGPGAANGGSAPGQPGPDAKRLRQQMRLMRRMGRLR